MKEIGQFVWCIFDKNFPYWPCKIYQKKDNLYQVYLFGDLEDKWKWINDKEIVNFENMTLELFENSIKNIKVSDLILKNLKISINEAERDRELQLTIKNEEFESKLKDKELVNIDLDNPSRIKDPIHEIIGRSYWRDLKLNSFFNFQDTISKIEKK